jgi:hypothetical protein
MNPQVGEEGKHMPRSKTAKEWGGKREGAGRPEEETRVKRVTISLPPDLLNQVDKIAYAVGGGSRSETIARLLRKALKSRL